MITWSPDRIACRHGPSSRRYCTSSISEASGSLHATVTGRPLGRIVMPQDTPSFTRRAASVASSCSNCSRVCVPSSAFCNSVRLSVASVLTSRIIVLPPFRPPLRYQDPYPGGRIETDGLKRPHGGRAEGHGCETALRPGTATPGGLGARRGGRRIGSPHILDVGR